MHQEEEPNAVSDGKTPLQQLYQLYYPPYPNVSNMTRGIHGTLTPNIKGKTLCWNRTDGDGMFAVHEAADCQRRLGSAHGLEEL